ncbi:bifunctional helix-turn-helix domain-containing protein/methylated-DNA--[protein]-cysteine S-methyltransferase [Wenyingzhuangia marina]|uniref:methylated-DNA--[protein]-cysteine S-methyltransferase n=1 Tax=Wenyingzhuangia marina TaxID=1195760 RepID=A0A1M5VW79_9FLAO|nr:methylated-DNA--[protein]-cysteine S-methyltransferase [Wenyingzhuangia marina]SHH79203.1 AraC family transcriptional regulator, regulatory protein of adaptative response / methylated-DNA-[protein]-cysteine methyltransferase [Wenyingzhuangia marina]
MITSMENNNNYQIIEKAIAFIEQHKNEQPSLETIAAAVNLSPHYFQKMFTQWAGVSPKKFLQYLNIQHAKNLLKTPEQTLFNTAIETGLSGTGRLHDLFIKIEGMTPGEYKNQGKNLTIYYQDYSSIFGAILIANTDKGICHISFIDDLETDIQYLKNRYPNATYKNEKHLLQNQAVDIFQNPLTNKTSLQLHIKGTDFQLKVWEALLKIPLGKLSTYGDIAQQIQQPKASRAVGTAIGNNPIAFLIPCHRVIKSTGVFGNYMWGATRKTSIIGWEAAKTEL